MSAKCSLTELIKGTTEVIMVPCVYDCGSALAAQLSGAQAILLSGGELGESLLGAPEMMLTADEVTHAVRRICSFAEIPLIVDCGAGFDNPLSAYRTARSFVESGAKGLLLGNEPGQTYEDYKAALRACLKACEGSDCIVIARKNTPLDTEEQIAETIHDLKECVDMGAAATMCCGLSHMPNASEVAARLGDELPGWGFYPDQNSCNGVPDVVNEEIWKHGFKMISYHYMMKVAVAAMWEYGLKNMQNKNNVASNEYAFPNGMTGASALPLFKMQEYMDMMFRFMDQPVQQFRVPGSRPGRENG